MRVTPWHPGAGLVYAGGHTVPPVHGAVPGCPALALRVTSCTFSSAIARQYLQASWGSLGDTANRGILEVTVKRCSTRQAGERGPSFSSALAVQGRPSKALCPNAF